MAYKQTDTFYSVWMCLGVISGLSISDAKWNMKRGFKPTQSYPVYET